MSRILLTFHPTSLTGEDKETAFNLTNFIYTELKPVIATLVPTEIQLEAVLKLIEDRIVERWQS